MSSYEEIWARHQELERAAQAATIALEDARSASAAAEPGSAERAQLEGIANQRAQEAMNAQNELKSFGEQVKATQPEHAKALDMGIAPEAREMAGFTEAAAPVVVAGVVVAAQKAGFIHPEYLAGSNISPLQVLKESVEAIKATPDYLAGSVAQHAPQVVEAVLDIAPPQPVPPPPVTPEQAASTEQTLHDFYQNKEDILGRPPSQADRQNAVTNEVEKTDAAAMKEKALLDMEKKHEEQRNAKEAQLDQMRNRMEEKIERGEVKDPQAMREHAAKVAAEEMARLEKQQAAEREAIAREAQAAREAAERARQDAAWVR